MSKIKKIFKSWRIIILLVVILMSIVAINPNFWREGVAIRSVMKNSSAELAGFTSAKPIDPPMNREIILSVNGQKIKTLKDYYEIEKTFVQNISVQIKTNKGLYRIVPREKYELINLNETEEKIIEETVLKNITINGTTEFYNETINQTITVPKYEKKILGTEEIGLKIYDAPTTNLRKGLDLQGGTRVLLQPEKHLSPEDMDTLLTNMKERLNVFGLSDVVIREAGDLSGNQYILVEIAGANEEEVKELIARQGKFEAKIGNDTVFSGGEDVRYVCRSAECSGIDPNYGCSAQGDGTSACRFFFQITLSPEAAQKQADTTKNLEIIFDNKNQYLSKKLDLYLDDQLVDSLNIGSELRGKAATDISISGAGAGTTIENAKFDALQSMKRLQTILITGSLPVKLTVVKTDNISPVLGKEFARNALVMALLAILAVTIVLIISYRKFIIAFPIALAMLSEVVILLGVASLIGWNIDLAAIAGILVAVGTGVDDQIVITDETMRKKKDEEIHYNWKQKMSNAFFIIMAAYFSLVVAMFPLLFAGAGLLKGFALTTIIGVSVGVFITRPAYAAVVEILVKEE